MKLIILGSGVCVPTKDRCQPSYFLKTEDHSFLFDIGEGSLHRMAQAEIDYFSIDGIFLSHLHCDHTSELVPFLFATNNNYRQKRKKRLFIAGPVSTKKWIEGLFRVYGRHIVLQDLSLTGHGRAFPDRLHAQLAALADHRIGSFLFHHRHDGFQPEIVGTERQGFLQDRLGIFN